MKSYLYDVNVRDDIETTLPKSIIPSKELEAHPPLLETPTVLNEKDM